MQTLTTMNLRKNLGHILDMVAENNEPVTISRANRPLAVILSIAEYEEKVQKKNRGQRLESLFGGHARSSVEKGRKIMAQRWLVQDDVVVFAAVDLEQAQLGLYPMNAIAAFAITSDFRGLAVGLRPATVARVQPKQVAVFDDSAIFQVVGRFVHRRRKLWLMQFERRVLQFFDQEAIDK